MTENENKNSEHTEGNEEPEKTSRRARPTRKTQSQALQEALGIKPEDLKDIEGKLSVIKSFPETSLRLRNLKNINKSMFEIIDSNSLFTFNHPNTLPIAGYISVTCS